MRPSAHLDADPQNYAVGEKMSRVLLERRLDTTLTLNYDEVRMTKAVQIFLLKSRKLEA